MSSYLSEDDRIDLTLFLLTGLERIPMGQPPVAPDPTSYLSRARTRDLASLLKDVAKAGNMTHAALGREIGVNAATMSRITNGHQRNITSTTVVRLHKLIDMICPALGPDLDYLVAGMKDTLRGGFYRDGRGGE
jgi:DNA-binding Xre family transcriptional regulator